MFYFFKIPTSPPDFGIALDLTTINSVIFSKIAACKRHGGGGRENGGLRQSQIHKMRRNCFDAKKSSVWK